MIEYFKLYLPKSKREVKIDVSVPRNKENIKVEVARHTIFSFIMLLLLIVSSVIEIFLSTNILKGVIKYFIVYICLMDKMHLRIIELPLVDH